MLKQQTGRSPSVAKAVVTGTATAMTCAFLCAAILARLVDGEMLKMEKMGYGIMGAHLLSVFLGVRAAMSRGGRQSWAAAGLTGGIYYLILLLVNALFFGGSYTGLGTTLLLTVLGTLGPMGMRTGSRNGKGRRRYKIPK